MNKIVKNCIFAQIDAGPHVKYNFQDPYPMNPDGEVSLPKDDGVMCLPMPGGLEFSNGANYEEGNDALRTILGLMPKTKANINESLREIGTADGFFAKVKKIGASLADPDNLKQAAEEGMKYAKHQSNLFGMTSQRAEALYDYSEHFFKGVPFRSFNFTHSLTPESQDETNEIQQIIFNFRKAVAPESRGKSAWYKRPLIVQPEFFHGATENIYIPKLEWCIIKNFTTNYSPQEPYHTHSGGAPTRVDITIELEEMIPITRAEVEKPGFGAIPDRKTMRFEKQGEDGPYKIVGVENG